MNLFETMSTFCGHNKDVHEQIWFWFSGDFRCGVLLLLLLLYINIEIRKNRC